MLQGEHSAILLTFIKLNAGQKYCRMLQGKHSAILLTFIKLPSVIKIIVLSIFEWPFYTGFTVHSNMVFKIMASLGSKDGLSLADRLIFVLLCRKPQIQILW